MSEINIYIPENEYGITEGYYNINEVVNLLRKKCDNPQAVHFIADMMEVQRCL